MSIALYPCHDFAANRELMGCALFFLCRCFERRKRSCSIATYLPFFVSHSGIRRRTNDGGNPHEFPKGGLYRVSFALWRWFRGYANDHHYAVPICRFCPDRSLRKSMRGFDSLSLKKSETDAGFSSSIS